MYCRSRAVPSPTQRRAVRALLFCVSPLGLLFPVFGPAFGAGAVDSTPSAPPSPTPTSTSTSTGTPSPEGDALAKDPLTRVDADQLAKVQSLLDAKRFALALSEIEFLLKTDSRNAILLKQKGFALRETGKTSEAITAYIDALKIDPSLHQAKEYLAVTYLRMGELKPAKQLYTELKKDAPDLARMLEAEAIRLKLKL